MEYDVVLLPSFGQVEAWCKERARKNGSGVFGQVVTTFDAWIADLWELHGDGRSLVSGLQREITMRSLLSKESGSLALPGMAALASSLVCSESGVAAFDAAVEEARGGLVDGLSKGECDLLRLLARYRHVLEDEGLIEFGEAAALLARQETEVFPFGANVLLVNMSPLSHIERSFFMTCASVRKEMEGASGADAVGRASMDIDVKFAFPSGRLAQPGLIADIICERLADGDVMATCRDPLALASGIEGRIVGEGACLRVEASKSLSQTAFGRAFLLHCRGLEEDPWNPATTSDAVLSPFSGFPLWEAERVDCRLRGNRLADRESELAALGDESDWFAGMQELAASADGEAVAEIVHKFELSVQAVSSRSAAWKSEQLAALRAVRDVLSLARAVGLGTEECAAVLEKVNVPVSYQVGEGDCAVTIIGQAGAARKPAGSCATLVLADLTSEDYPVANRDDSAATLLEKLGIAPADNALSRARREFNALLSLPTEALVLVRPLGDDGAAETYPSAVLEDFIDAYREDLSSGKDVDNPYRLPKVLQGGMAERGEELLYANALAVRCGEMQDSVDELRPAPERIGSDDVRLGAPFRKKPNGEMHDKPCPSPSQIESYLECPYKWYASSRLRVGGLDEGFGPLEQGSFAHSVLETFYRRYQDSGRWKVTKGDLADAKELMGRTFDELASAQFERKPGTSRYVPRTELERRQEALLRSQLISYLDFEAELLPTFNPAYFEYRIPTDEPAGYAGGLLVGTVDRIDVDDEGNAVIIDYKGSVNDEHLMQGKHPGRPGKVQARIYAQVVARRLGLNVVGALYVSYGRKQVLSGAFDPSVLGRRDLPRMDWRKCACGGQGVVGLSDEDFLFSELSFGQMLDATEDVAKRAIARMVAGDVEPRPAYDDVCRYCPATSCKKRIG